MIYRVPIPKWYLKYKERKRQKRSPEYPDIKSAMSDIYNWDAGPSVISVSSSVSSRADSCMSNMSNRRYL